ASLPMLRAVASDASAATAALTTQIGDIETVLDEAKAATERGASLLAWLANARFNPGSCLVVAGLAFGLFAIALIFAGLFQRWGAALAAGVSAVVSLLLPALMALAAIVAWARRHLVTASKAFAVLDSLRARLEAARIRRLSEHELTLQAALRAAAEAEAE